MGTPARCDGAKVRRMEMERDKWRMINGGRIERTVGAMAEGRIG